MSALNPRGEKPLNNSSRSISISNDSVAPTVSVNDCEDPEKANVPEVYPAPIQPHSSGNAASVGTTGTNDPDFEVDWDEDDRRNPRNWPMWYKCMAIGFISWSTWVVVVYSTSYTTSLAEMGAEFHISSEPIITLGVTSYCKLHLLRCLWFCFDLQETSDWSGCGICASCTYLGNVRSPPGLHCQHVRLHNPNRPLCTCKIVARNHCRPLFRRLGR